jgi:hypothetical protein
LRVEGGEIAFTDGVFGEFRQDVEREVGDFVVRREQPVPTYAYQLAVVVDDADQGITPVVRGAFPVAPMHVSSHPRGPGSDLPGMRTSRCS